MFGSPADLFDDSWTLVTRDAKPDEVASAVRTGPFASRSLREQENRASPQNDMACSQQSDFNVGMETIEGLFEGDLTAPVLPVALPATALWRRGRRGADAGLTDASIAILMTELERVSQQPFLVTTSR